MKQNTITDHTKTINKFNVESWWGIQQLKKRPCARRIVLFMRFKDRKVDFLTPLVQFLRQQNFIITKKEIPIMVISWRMNVRKKFILFFILTINNVKKTFLKRHTVVILYLIVWKYFQKSGKFQEWIIPLFVE